MVASVCPRFCHQSGAAARRHPDLLANWKAIASTPNGCAIAYCLGVVTRTIRLGDSQHESLTSDPATTGGSNYENRPRLKSPLQSLRLAVGLRRRSAHSFIRLPFVDSIFSSLVVPCRAWQLPSEGERLGGGAVVRPGGAKGIVAVLVRPLPAESLTSQWRKVALPLLLTYRMCRRTSRRSGGGCARKWPRRPGDIDASPGTSRRTAGLAVVVGVAAVGIIFEGGEDDGRGLGPFGHQRAVDGPVGARQKLDHGTREMDGPDQFGKGEE